MARGLSPIVLCSIVLAFAGCDPAPLQQAERVLPLDGIVLVISDGTSQELITAARTYAYGATGHLGLESFPQTAIVRTHSREDVVTDSSAGATAMARGIKADNRVVGMADPHSATSPPSLLDLAKKAGWSTGVVTDDSVTGATPASFVVEHPSRWEDARIASKTVDQLGTRADIVLGGGAKWFSDLSGTWAVLNYKPEEQKIVRATQAKLATGKVAAFSDWKEFTEHARKGGDNRPILGTFFPAEFPFYVDGTRDLRVADMAVEAVRFLRAKGKPFFLMVEAGLPDKGSHRGQAKRAISEVLELDHMLTELRKNLSSRTLLLVTTDHSTGGLAINGPPVPIGTRGDALLGRNPITNASSILSWATGPGSDLEKANNRERTIIALGEPMKVVQERKQSSDSDFQQPAALGGGSAMHTGGDVWLLGEGPGSELVHGYLENTDIYRLISSKIGAAAR